MSSDPSVNSDTIEQTKQQIRGLVSEIAQLSKSDLEPREYYAAFLQRIVQALAAVGGAIWILTEGRRPKLMYQIKLSETLLDPDSEDAGQHLRMLGQIVQKGEPELIPPLSGTTADGSGGNPTRYLLVIAPLGGEGQVEGLVEIFQRPDAPPNTQRGYLRFLVQMCELASEWLKSQKLKQFSDRHSLWAQADHFSRLVHESLDIREAAYTIVNEGRRLIGCDRVSLAIKRGRTCTVEAISGQDTIESRSNIVHALGQLASKVVATGEPLWYEGSTEDLPPQVEKSVNSYIEESYAKSVSVLPLRKPDSEDRRARLQDAGRSASDSRSDREIMGALIIEQIEVDLPREVVNPRVDLVYEHSARALSNALDHHNIFLMPLWKTIGKSRLLVRARTLPKTLAVAAAVLTALIVLFLVPGNFDMKCTGALQPKERVEVFADLDGQIREVLVDHGSEVQKGDVLVRMINPDLSVQLERVQGELNSTAQQLIATQSALASQARLKLPPEERSRLAGQANGFQRQIESFEKQLALLQAKTKKLEVRSPLAGKVVTWDPVRTLQNRPVQTGQVLMTIARTDTESEWELELDMPERRIGHILVAERDSAVSKPLAVKYILASDPDKTRDGKVAKIHQRSDVTDQETGPVVRISVQIDQEELRKIPLRPGTTVSAKVHCGRKALVWVWFHEAWEWVERKVLF